MLYLVRVDDEDAFQCDQQDLEDYIADHIGTERCVFDDLEVWELKPGRKGKHPLGRVDCEDLAEEIRQSLREEQAYRDETTSIMWSGRI